MVRNTQKVEKTAKIEEVEDEVVDEVIETVFDPAAVETEIVKNTKIEPQVNPETVNDQEDAVTREMEGVLDRINGIRTELRATFMLNKAESRTFLVEILTMLEKVTLAVIEGRK